jgi:predicted RNase H-like HicB family nuclease
MTYIVNYEKIDEPGFEGWYYAHIPAFDLTTHGLGIDGARAAAEDLLKVWIEVKLEHGESIPPSDKPSPDTIDVEIDALQTA